MTDEGAVEVEGRADQEQVFACLADPATHGLDAVVKRIDTHGAGVFLAGENVYKVKRAVRFAFLNYSTLEKRRRACEAEIAVNRENAPQLYLGTVPIVRRDGGLALGGDGEVVEWAVHLRRFDEEATLDRLAERGAFPDDLVPQLASEVLAAHARAPLRQGRAATAALGGVIAESLDQLAAAPQIFDAGEVARLGTEMRAAFVAERPLLIERGDGGRVRRCHGDLHLRNIAVVDGAPVLFDAIEFDEAIATGDVLYDLAFLIMDLWQRGLRAAANAVLNRYLWGSADQESEIRGLSALPLFLALRAVIRAKVAAAAAGQGAGAAKVGEARDYFAAATAFLAPEVPGLIAVGGLSGTGKTTLAARLAPRLGRAPGAVHLRSDIVRKCLFAVAETARLPEDAYTAAVTKRVYEALRRGAAAALRAGRTVIVDAVHLRQDERAAIAAVAAEVGAPFTALWLDAAAATLEQRVTARRGDASDADAAVVRRQLDLDPGVVDWHRLDAGAGIDMLAERALALCAPPAPADDAPA